MQSDTCILRFLCLLFNFVYESFINCSILVGYRYFTKGLNALYSFWIVINLCLVSVGNNR